MIRICLLGAGFMGTTHARAYTQIPDTQVVAIIGKNPERAKQLANEIGSRVSQDFEQILSDPTVDVVDITLPTPLHPEFAVQALNAGKHVILEKPIALSLPEADVILEAASRSEKFLMVAHVIRFWPEYMALQEIIQSRRIGKPRLATAYRLSNMPQWADWFRDPHSFGGAVLDLQIHDLDFLNLIFGKPVKVSATGLQDETGGWNHVITLLEYPEGRASVEASCILPRDYPFTAGLRVLCEGGAVEYNFRAGGASFEQGQPNSSLLLHEPGHPNQPIRCPHGNGYYNELSYFTRCIMSNIPPDRITPAEARLAVETALLSRQALEQGEEIKRC
jgi:UDP-N-acetylglucosamine 3-dehydrogenase